MTQWEHVSLDVDPTLNRRQPPPLGCVRILFVVLLLVVVLLATGVGAFAYYTANQSPPLPTVASLPTLSPTPEHTEEPTLWPTATPTLDDWSATGTALAIATASLTPTPSPTLDYCWWLTPSPTPTPTLAYTPDAWQATGTAIYDATHPYASPTRQPPRELCIEYAQLLVLPTEEATSEIIFVTMTPGIEQTVTITGPLREPLLPTSNVSVSGGRSVYTTPQPQIIVQTAPPLDPVIVVQTSPPQIIIATNPPDVPTVTRDADWYASATAYWGTVLPLWTETVAAGWTQFAPTATPSATPTGSAATEEVTEQPALGLTPETTPEATPTMTEVLPTASETPTATWTPTETATESPTATATDMPTETALPTATPETPEGKSQDA